MIDVVNFQFPTPKYNTYVALWPLPSHQKRLIFAVLPAATFNQWYRGLQPTVEYLRSPSEGFLC